MSMDVPKERSTRWGGRRAWLAALLLVVGGAAAAWVLARSMSATLEIDEDAIVIVRAGDLANEIVVLGTLQPERLLSMTSASEAQVKDIPAHPGVEMQQGSVLAVLDSPRLGSELEAARLRMLQTRNSLRITEAESRSSIESARSKLAQADAALDYARMEHEARRRVFEGGAMSRIQVEESNMRYRLGEADMQAARQTLATAQDIDDARIQSARDELAIAEAQYRRLERDVEALVVRAPADGSVLDFIVKPGDSVAPGGQVLRFAEGNEMFARLDVPEDQAVAIEIGAPGRVEWRGQVLHGRVSRIHPVARSGYMQVDLAFDSSPDSVVSVDATVRGRVTGRPHAGALHVRGFEHAEENSTQAVYLLAADGTSATARQVRFGPRVGDALIVESGLAAGDRILDREVRAQRQTIQIERTDDD